MRSPISEAPIAGAVSESARLASAVRVVVDGLGLGALGASGHALTSPTRNAQEGVVQVGANEGAVVAVAFLHRAATVAREVFLGVAEDEGDLGQVGEGHCRGLSVGVSVVGELRRDGAVDRHHVGLVARAAVRQPDFFKIRERFP